MCINRSNYTGGSCNKTENCRDKTEKGGEIMLDIQNISKTFEKGTVNEHVAINNMSLKLEDGEFVTIVGSNGAGKSTLFNAICGSFMVDSGHILLDGKDITYDSEHSRAKVIGRVFQDPMKGTAPNMTIEENLALAYSRASKGSNPFARAITKKKVEFFRENLARYNMGIEDRMKTCLLYTSDAADEL